MSFLNLGVLAHVDAGKTSLTERILFDTGAINRLGSVDSGTTSTDTLDQERRRGITIRSAVATFSIGDLTVNVIDTPGHPDFIAEVERALSVLDAAVLVVSAVEGVQAQTRVLLRALQRAALPTLVFVNKTDRVGANPDAVVRNIPNAVAMWADHAETVAELDDKAFADFVEDRPEPPDVLRRLTKGARIFPAFKGSAITGHGVGSLLEGIASLLPVASGSSHEPLHATVFKIESDRSALVRVHEGTLRVRDRIGGDRVTSIDEGRADAVVAGDIGRIRGLRSVQVGDDLGGGARATAVFPEPTGESTIRSLDPRRRSDLHNGLKTLSDRDPLIGLRFDPGSDELTVSLYGEVQKEVIRDTLAAEFGIEVVFGSTVTILREKPAGSTEVGIEMGQDGNLYAAGLRVAVEPAEGIHVRLAAPIEHIPTYLYRSSQAFRVAIEEYVRESLSRGGLNGWDVNDVRVTVTDCSYFAPVTGASDFRRIVSGLLRRALTETGTILCEPVAGVEITCPADTFAGVLRVAFGCEMEVNSTEFVSDIAVICGKLAAARLRELERKLPMLGRGEASVVSEMIGWRPIDR